MKDLERFAKQLHVKLEASFDIPALVEVGGPDWVVNISTRGVHYPDVSRG